MRLSRFFAALLGLLLLVALPVHAQVDAAITLRVEAGYQTYYRENFWMPLRIVLTNQSDNLTGKLMVRPETSGRIVSNAYSVPVDLPTGSEKAVFLYVQARSFPPQLTVELLDDGGARLLQQVVVLQHVDKQAALHVIVGSNTSTVTLAAARSTGREAHEARWTVASIPDNAAALRAINSLWFVGVDTSSLSEAQREAIELYVLNGGHLVVTGGPAWQETTAGLAELLPLMPSDTRTITEATGLAQFAGDTVTLGGRAVAATGELRENALVLAAAADGTPLLVRQQYGNGTIDFLTLDPSLAPMNDWGNMGALWRTLLVTEAARPFWTQGVVDTQNAATAMAILPGIDLLPPVASLLLFLVAYVAAIGPLNYLLLNRFNRRGWAWLSIPACILVFSGVAWSVGFNLRGNDVTLSRINVVKAWSDSETAQLDQLISVLAPRRGVFSLQIPAGRFLNVMPTLAQSGLLQTNTAQSTAEIVQHTAFSADHFAVDGGIFANFGIIGTTPKPDIGGAFTLIYNADGSQALQGVVRNDSDITLNDPVLLARGIARRLGEPLAPGDVVTFDALELMIAERETMPSPASLELPYEKTVALRDTREMRALNSQTITGILRGDTRADNAPPPPLPGSAAEQAANRRQAILNAFLGDLFASPGRGDEVYLAGWSDAMADDVTLDATKFTQVNTTLYLFQLETSIAPTTSTVTLMPDQFTWNMLERENVEGNGPSDLTLLTDSSAIIQYNPIPTAQLRQVDEFTVLIDRSSSYGRRVALSVWNYNLDDWETVPSYNDETYRFTNAEAYLDAKNAVLVRLTMDFDFGSAWIRNIGITQKGRF